MTSLKASLLSTAFPILRLGIDWKREQRAVEAEAKLGELGRFAPGLPKISDGQQLLF